MNPTSEQVKAAFERPVAFECCGIRLEARPWVLVSNTDAGPDYLEDRRECYRCGTKYRLVAVPTEEVAAKLWGGSSVVRLHERFFIADLRSPRSGDLRLWKPDGNGYTFDADEAGRFTRDEYEARVSPNERTTHVLIPVDKALSVSHRFVPAREVGL